MTDKSPWGFNGRCSELQQMQRILERRSLGIGYFPLSEKISRYRDRSDVQNDLLAVIEGEHRIRYGTSKRNSDRLMGSVDSLNISSERFCNAHPRFNDWHIEFVAIAPVIDDRHRVALKELSVSAESLSDLMVGL